MKVKTREDFSDPSVIDQPQGRTRGAVGARASISEHAAMSVPGKVLPGVVVGVAAGAVVGAGGGQAQVGTHIPI